MCMMLNDRVSEVTHMEIVFFFDHDHVTTLSRVLKLKFIFRLKTRNQHLNFFIPYFIEI
jgi:hypothetical protein